MCNGGNQWNEKDRAKVRGARKKTVGCRKKSPKPSYASKVIGSKNTHLSWDKLNFIKIVSYNT